MAISWVEQATGVQVYKKQVKREVQDFSSKCSIFSVKRRLGQWPFKAHLSIASRCVCEGSQPSKSFIPRKKWTEDWMTPPRFHDKSVAELWWSRTQTSSCPGGVFYILLHGSKVLLRFLKAGFQGWWLGNHSISSRTSWNRPLFLPNSHFS